MPLRTLIVIALRLYAIYWFLDAVPQISIYFPAFVTLSPCLGVRADHIQWLLVLMPIGMFLFSICLWVWASWLADQVTKGCETQLTVASLTRDDFYRIAFVFLGLYFVLSSISQTVQSATMFFLLDFPLPANSERKWHYLWPFLGHVLALALGLACVWGASHWSKKLIRLENKGESLKGN